MEKAKKSKLPLFRNIVQLSVFVFLFTGSVLGVYEAHKVCPFGGVETAYTLVTTGEYVQKVHPSSMVLLILGLAVTLLFGAVFCGFICPLGTLQEFIGKIGKKAFPKFHNKNIPDKLDKTLRFFRYVILGVIIYLTTAVGKLVFQGYDPFYAVMNVFSDEVSAAAFVILGIILILSLFIERPFCKYACPFGAVLGIVSLLSVFKIQRNKKTCINCGLCDKNCPMNIEISSMKTVKNHQCIGCFTCTSGVSCPVSNTVYLATKPVFTDKEAGDYEN